MKIAIHNFTNSFSERWIKYCEQNCVDYKLVDCYASNIIEQMQDCDGLMWHWNQADPKAVLFGRQLTYSLETMGKKVFPSSSTCWHFDDKVGQKYLLEAIEAPFVQSYCFYDKKDALEWVEKTGFPKVFKLRGGAGALNVKLAHTKNDAKKLIKQAFGKGFSPVASYTADYKTKLKRAKSLSAVWGKIKRAPEVISKASIANKVMGKELGYVYFQEFIPNNDSDIRIIVIGDKAFGLKRLCREGDFRASGSGKIIYDKEQIDERCVEIAFETSEKIKAQCLAYDFVFDEKNNPLIVEISYGFTVKAYDDCPGYWDRDINWYEGKFNPQAFMADDFLATIR